MEKFSTSPLFLGRIDACKMMSVGKKRIKILLNECDAEKILRYIHQQILGFSRALLSKKILNRYMEKKPMKFKVGKLDLPMIVTEIKRPQAKEAVLVLRSGEVVELSKPELDYMIENSLVPKGLLITVVTVAEKGDHESDQSRNKPEGYPVNGAKAGNKVKQ